jgi:hypothetical protein
MQREPGIVDSLWNTYHGGHVSRAQDGASASHAC